MTCWNKEQLENMLEDVVNELDLSGTMIEEHGPLGTPPAELVRLVLDRKDQEIRMLKQGFQHRSDPMTPTYQWLRDMGAVRPMAPTGHHILVLGDWTHGVYPIEWQRKEGAFIKTPEGRVTGRESIETWHVLGVSTAQPLTREDCKRILRAMKGTK